MRIGLLMLISAGAIAGAASPSIGAAPARPACHIALRAEADTQSFADAGRDATPARTTQLTNATGTAFATAANHLCASGAVRPANFTRYNRLLVRNAEGAAEPNVYDDAEEQAGALIIEYAFTNGGPPAQPAIEHALRCWRNPQGAGCSAEDVGP